MKYYGITNTTVGTISMDALNVSNCFCVTIGGVKCDDLPKLFGGILSDEEIEQLKKDHVIVTASVGAICLNPQNDEEDIFQVRIQYVAAEKVNSLFDGVISDCEISKLHVKNEVAATSVGDIHMSKVESIFQLGVQIITPDTVKERFGGSLSDDEIVRQQLIRLFGKILSEEEIMHLQMHRKIISSKMVLLKMVESVFEHAGKKAEFPQLIRHFADSN